MDPISEALEAVAEAYQGWSLDGSGGNLVVASTTSDHASPPSLTVEAVAVRWANTSRTDGSAVIDVAAVLVLPSPTPAVSGAMITTALAGFCNRLQAKGRTLGGRVAAWRAIEARPGTETVGSRTQPTVVFQLEIWANGI